MHRIAALGLVLAFGIASSGEKPVFVKWEQALGMAQASGKPIAVFASIGADGKG